MMSFRKLIHENVDEDALASYLCADWGHTLGVYADGKVSVGQDVGHEIDPDERPVATAKCPGLGNLDMTWWREGVENEKSMDDEDVIRSSCRDGDVTSELDALRLALYVDAVEYGGVE